MIKKYLCSVHGLRGVEPGQPLTFSPGCTMCWFLQERGDRSGNEPRPGKKQARAFMRGPRIPSARFATRKQQREAAREQRALWPDARIAR